MIIINNNIFITGGNSQERSGLLKRVLSGKLDSAGGITMEQEFNENSIWYSLYPASKLGNIEGLTGEKFLIFSSGLISHDTEVFRNLGCSLLDEAEFYPYCIINEIGFFELIVPQFREKLINLLNSDCPAVCLIKTKEEAENMRTLVGISDKFIQYYDSVVNSIYKSGNQIIDLDALSAEDVEKMTSEWFMKYVL